MSKFELYNIVLKDITTETLLNEYELNDLYFKKIDSPEVQKGLVIAQVKVQRIEDSYELTFKLDGEITIPCDRCLDDMHQPIHYNDKLIVKFGAEFSEEDEVVFVPESDGAINIAWFLYEFIVLNIPMKHVHAPGECNKTMATKLKKYITKSKDEEETTIGLDDDDELENEEGSIDPRWEGLQNILDN